MSPASPQRAAARRETTETNVLSLCAGGHQYPLVWRHCFEQQPVPTNEAQEMWLAGGGTALAEWNGFCSRCGAAVEWSTDKPRDEQPKRRTLSSGLLAAAMLAAVGAPMSAQRHIARQGSRAPETPSQTTPADTMPEHIIPTRIRRAAEKRARRAAKRRQQ